MKYIITPLLGLFAALFGLLCPVLVLFTIPFIKWDKLPSSGSWGTHYTIRGDLPNWLSWFSTPDERLPGGLYERTVEEVFTKYGKTVCSYYWLGLRNRAMGLAVFLGKPTTDYIPEEPMGFWERDDIWRYAKKLGKLKFVTGYQVYRKLDKSFVAVPVFTLKRY